MQKGFPCANFELVEAVGCLNNALQISSHKGQKLNEHVSRNILYKVMRTTITQRMVGYVFRPYHYLMAYYLCRSVYFYDDGDNDDDDDCDFG